MRYLQNEIEIFLWIVWQIWDLFMKEEILLVENLLGKNWDCDLNVQNGFYGTQLG